MYVNVFKAFCFISQHTCTYLCIYEIHTERLCKYSLNKNYIKVNVIQVKTLWFDLSQILSIKLTFGILKDKQSSYVAYIHAINLSLYRTGENSRYGKRKWATSWSRGGPGWRMWKVKFRTINRAMFPHFVSIYFKTLRCLSVYVCWLNP